MISNIGPGHENINGGGDWRSYLGNRSHIISFAQPQPSFMPPHPD